MTEQWKRALQEFPQQVEILPADSNHHYSSSEESGAYTSKVLPNTRLVAPLLQSSLNNRVARAGVGGWLGFESNGESRP